MRTVTEVEPPVFFTALSFNYQIFGIYLYKQYRPANEVRTHCLLRCVPYIITCKILSVCCSFVQNGSLFIKSLAMGSVQLVGSTISAPLPGLSSKMSNGDSLLTISAGLPHFSVGLWRSWGRDTFISLRGLLLVTGRFEEAR